MKCSCLTTCMEPKTRRRMNPKDLNAPLPGTSHGSMLLAKVSRITPKSIFRSTRGKTLIRLNKCPAVSPNLVGATVKSSKWLSLGNIRIWNPERTSRNPISPEWWCGPRIPPLWMMIQRLVRCPMLGNRMIPKKSRMSNSTCRQRQQPSKKCNTLIEPHLILRKWAYSQSATRKHHGTTPGIGGLGQAQSPLRHRLWRSTRVYPVRMLEEGRVTSRLTNHLSATQGIRRGLHFLRIRKATMGAMMKADKYSSPSRLPKLMNLRQEKELNLDKLKTPRPTKLFLCLQPQMLPKLHWRKTCANKLPSSTRWAETWPEGLHWVVELLPKRNHPSFKSSIKTNS